MLNDETIARRLRVMKGWVDGIRNGTKPATEQTFRTVSSLLEECAGQVEQLELAAGTASVPDQLKAAGKNPVMLRAVLRQAAEQKAVRHG